MLSLQRSKSGARARATCREDGTHPLVPRSVSFISCSRFSLDPSLARARLHTPYLGTNESGHGDAYRRAYTHMKNPIDDVQLSLSAMSFTKWVGESLLRPPNSVSSAAASKQQPRQEHKHPYLSQWEKKRLSLLIFFKLHQPDVTLTTMRVASTRTGVAKSSPVTKPATAKPVSHVNVKDDMVITKPQ